MALERQSCDQHPASGFNLHNSSKHVAANTEGLVGQKVSPAIVNTLFRLLRLQLHPRAVVGGQIEPASTILRRCPRSITDDSIRLNQLLPAIQCPPRILIRPGRPPEWEMDPMQNCPVGREKGKLSSQ